VTNTRAFAILVFLNDSQCGVGLLFLRHDQLTVIAYRHRMLVVGAKALSILAVLEFARAVFIARAVEFGRVPWLGISDFDLLLRYPFDATSIRRRADWLLSPAFP